MDPVFITSALLILLFSVICHEVAHGLVAKKFGDRTAEHAGRLTLNPLPHIDPIGTVILPLLLLVSGSPFLFGWAKPVPVNPLNFRNIRKGEIATSLAGIGANLLLALTAAVALHLAVGLWPNILAIRILNYAVNINLVLAVFNLLPVPPLDGSRVVSAIASANVARFMARIEPYGFFILIALMMIPIGGVNIIGAYLEITVATLRILLGLG